MSRLLKFVVLFLMLPSILYAADTSRKIEFKKISDQLSLVETQIKAGTLSLDEIDEKTTNLYEISNELSENKRFNEREAKSVQKQLDALGDLEEGTTELGELSKKRKELKDELALFKSRMAEADVLQVKIEDLNLQILNFKSQKVLGDLVNKKEILLIPQNFVASIKSLGVFLWDMAKSPVHWYGRLDDNGKTYVLTYFIPVIFILVITIWLGIFLRRLILKNWGYQENIEYPNTWQRLVAAFANAVAYGVVPAFIISGFLGWLIGTKIFMVGFFGQILEIGLVWILYIFLARAVNFAILAPQYERWRPVPVSNKKAVQISKAINLSILLIAVPTFLEFLAVKATYEPILINLLAAICSVAKAFAVVLITAKIVSPGEDGEDSSRVVAFRINVLTGFFALTAIGISLFGYPELSAYILNRYIASALLLGVFLIAKKGLSEFLRRIFIVGLWGKTFRSRRKLLVKVNFALSLLFNPFVVLCFIFALLHLWGFSSDFLIHVVKKIFFGFSIGGVHISLIAVIFGIVAFFVCFALVKIFKNHVMQTTLTHLEVDDGIKHSLDSFITFIGVILSVLMAIVVMGGSLTNLTVIAGALSVGIGFGLQNIINNFVSGIIILFERPFKVGDWVVIDEQEGQIKQINIRSTELETFKKTSVIVPNATLLSSSVINMTHGNNWTRLSVTVGVAYGSDVEKVRDILIECALNNSKVLKRPAPYVLFQDFGESSLNFDLRCYSSNIWEGWSIPSELRFAINKRFIEEGIEIPFPQVVVHNGDAPTKNESIQKQK